MNAVGLIVGGLFITQIHSELQVHRYSYRYRY